MRSLISWRWAFVLFWLFVTPARAAAQETGDSPQAVAEEKGFLEIVFSGGVSGIVIMSALIALSLTATYLIIEHLWTIRRTELLPEGLADTVRQLVVTGKFREADEACQAKPSLLSFILAHGLAETDGDWSSIEKALEDATAEQSARLFRKVEYLSVIGNIGPMLGLLGTVTGMIQAFQQVASTQGSAGAADLAEGIYEALVTTVAGLIIAIPSLGAFAIFRNRVDEIVADAAYVAHHALNPLKRRDPSARTPSGPPGPPPPPRGGRG